MKEFFREQFPFIKGPPFVAEHIPARKTGQWRIADREDDPVGSADTEQEAAEMVRDLNNGWRP